MTHTDTGKLSRSAQEAIRFKAVQAVVVGGMTQTEAAKVFGVSRTAACLWVKAWRQEGERALKTKQQGRPLGGKLTREHMMGIKKSILGKCPDQLRLPGLLWTRELFRRQGHGNCLYLASIYGVLPPRFEIYEGTTMTMPIEYAAIKTSLIFMAKYYAKYYKNTNIRFNCISPGGILDQQPTKFLGAYNKLALSKGMLHPDDILGTVCFLLSDASRYINGQNLIVDDGWTL